MGLRGSSGGSGGSSDPSKYEVIVKSIDETINDDDILHNDDELEFPIAANETVFARLVWCAIGNTVADLQFTIIGPSGMDANSKWDIGISSSGNAFASVQTIAISGPTVPHFKNIGMIIQNGATAGTVNFQWAQQTKTAGNTTIMGGSYIEVFRV